MQEKLQAHFTAFDRTATYGLNAGEYDALSEGDYVEFSYALDTEQLPRPMQIALPGASEWALRIERELKVPAS